ncbi:MAG: hypothetical protein AAFN76_01390 [Pseudomonadota bacterium]
MSDTQSLHCTKLEVQVCMPNIFKSSYDFFNGQDKMPSHIVEKLNEHSRPQNHILGKFWEVQRAFQTIAHQRPKLKLKPASVTFVAFQHHTDAPFDKPIMQGQLAVGLSTRTTDVVSGKSKMSEEDCGLELAERQGSGKGYGEDDVDIFSSKKVDGLKCKVRCFLDIAERASARSHKNRTRKARKKDDAFIKTQHDLLRVRSEALGEIQRALVQLEQESELGAPVPCAGTYEELILLAVDLAFPDVALALHHRPGTDGDLLINKESPDRVFSQIQQKRRAFAKQVSELRQQADAEPKDRAKVTGAFLYAVANSTLITGLKGKTQDGMGWSSEAKTALQQIDIGNELLSAISTGNAMMDTALTTINTDLPEVRAVLRQQRQNYYADVAASRFLAKLKRDDKGKYKESLNKLDQLKLKYKGHFLTSPADMTRYEVAAIIPKDLRPKFESLLRNARSAAQAREAYETQRIRMFRSLGIEQGQRAERALNIAARGIEIIDLSTLEDDSTLSEPADRQFLDRQSTINTIKGLARGNKAGAFQIARFAACIEEMVKLETEALGYNSLHLDPELIFDSETVLEVTGLTEKDVRKLGYDLKQVSNINDNLARLGETGLNNAKEAKRALKKVYTAARKTLSDRSNQDALKSKLDKETRLLAEQIHADLMTDAQLMYQVTHHHVYKKVSPLGRRIAALRGINGAINEALFDGPNKANSKLFKGALEKEQSNYADAEIRKLELLHEKADEEARIKKEMTRLASATSDVRVLDPGTRSGVACARLILKALALDKGQRERGKDNSRELRRTLQRLAGFDQEAFRILSKKQRRIGKFEVPEIERLEKLRDAAEAILYLKVEAPFELKAIQSEIDDQTLQQLKALDRRASAAPGMFNAVYRMIYAATIEHMSPEQRVDPPEGQLNAVYNMASKKDDIQDTLRTWGMDVNAFRIEIDYVLGQRIDGQALSTIRNDIRSYNFSDLLGFRDERLTSARHWTTKLPFLLQSFVGREPSLSEVGEDFRGAYKQMGNYWNNKRQIDNILREDLESLFGVLRPGEKYDLAAGYQIEINTRKIPLDPTTTIRIRVRASRAFHNRLRVDVNEDGSYTISGLSEWKLGTRSDVELAPSLLPDSEGIPVLEHLNPYTRLGLKAEGRLHYGRGTGYSITFPPGEAGKTAAIELLMKATEHEKPSAQVIEMADHVAIISGRTNQQRARMGFMGLFGAALTAGNSTYRDESGPRTGLNGEQGPGHEHFSGVNWERVQKFEEHENIDGKTVKTEVVYEQKVYTDLELYGTYWSGVGIATAGLAEITGWRAATDERSNDGGTGAHGSDAVSPTAITEINRITNHVKIKKTNKRKIQFDKIGNDGRELLKNSELSETTTLNGRQTLLAVIGQIVEDKENKMILDSRIQVVRDLLKLADQPELENASFEVTYRLSDEKIKIYNDLNTEARNLRGLGYSVQAQELEQEAKRLLKDRKNYTLGSISILLSSSQSTAKFRGAGMVIHRKRLAEVSTERLVAMVEF